MKNVDFDKICRDVLASLKDADAFQKSTVYVCAEVLKRYHAAVNAN